jgi:uncharacterized protein YsxB (DUF464 family)
LPKEDVLIRVRIRRRKGEIVEVRVRGHGPLAPGRDVLCAAVSAVTQTGLQGLLHYGPDSVRWERDGGFLTMRVDPESLDDERRAIFQVILTTLHRGLQSIREENPEHMILESEDDTGVSHEA